MQIRPSSLLLFPTFLILPACQSASSPTSAHPGLTSPTTIHQEIVFNAPPGRVYDALTDGEKFAALTKRPVAQMSRDVGGPFSCFGGIITGRQIELVPNERIVQAWHERVWGDGIYSIVKFELKPEGAGGAGTRLVFDHTGFPADAGDHLSIGWYENYWGPLANYLERK